MTAQLCFPGNGGQFTSSILKNNTGSQFWIYLAVNHKQPSPVYDLDDIMRSSTNGTTMLPIFNLSRLDVKIRKLAHLLACQLFWSVCRLFGNASDEESLLLASSNQLIHLPPKHSLSTSCCPSFSNEFGFGTSSPPRSGPQEWYCQTDVCSNRAGRFMLLLLSLVYLVTLLQSQDSNRRDSATSWCP